MLYCYNLQYDSFNSMRLYNNIGQNSLYLLDFQDDALSETCLPLVRYWEPMKYKIISIMFLNDFYELTVIFKHLW